MTTATLPASRRQRRGTCFLLLLFIVFFVPSMVWVEGVGAQDLRAELQRIDALEAAAEAEALAVFAPEPFEEAQALLREARGLVRQRQTARAQAMTRRAEAILEQARRSTAEVRGRLERALAARAQARQKELVSAAPEEYQAADRLLERAAVRIRRGGPQARSVEAQVIAAYREAVVAGLHAAVLAPAEQRLRGDRQQRERLRDVRQHLEQLAREPFPIDRAIADFYGRIDDLVGRLPVLITPPDTLLVGDFVLVVENYERRSWNADRERFEEAAGTARTRICIAGGSGGRLPDPYGPIRFDPEVFQLDRDYVFTVVQQVEDPETQVSVEAAQEVEPEARVGDRLDIAAEQRLQLSDLARFNIDPRLLDVVPQNPGIFDVLNQEEGIGLRVRFDDFDIEPIREHVGRVHAGVATYPTDPPDPQTLTFERQGFDVQVDSLFIRPPGATARLEVALPPSLVDISTGERARLQTGLVDFSRSCAFYTEAPEAVFGTWAVGTTGVEIEGEGLVLDFSPTRSASGSGLSNNWQGVVLRQGRSVAASGVVSNTGYLKAPYRFANAHVTGSGLEASLELSQAFSFTTLEPYGFAVELEEGKLAIEASDVAGGRFEDGQMGLPAPAVRDDGGAAITLDYPRFEIQSDRDMVGYLDASGTTLTWGEFARSRPGVEAYAAEQPEAGFFYFAADYRPPFLPLDGGGDFQEIGWSNSTQLFEDLETRGAQGAWFFAFEALQIHTPDVPTGAPIAFGNSSVRGSWLLVGSQGVHGSFPVNTDRMLTAATTPLGPTYESFYEAPEAFETTFAAGVKGDTVGRFRFVDSAVYESGLDGHVELGMPTDADVPFERMAFTSTAHNAGARVVLEEAVALEHWGLDLVQQPGRSAAGVISVKSGKIFLTGSGLAERRHFASPFYLTWGEMLADGAFSTEALSFDMNAARQQFDGFGFTPAAVSLSPYSSGLPADSAYLQVGGTAHLDLFGAQYLHVLDYNHPSETASPFDGRRVVLADSSGAGGMQPTERRLQANWSNGFADLDYRLRYNANQQDGFLGPGQLALHRLFGPALTSDFILDRSGLCINVAERQAADMTIGPVTHFGVASEITGCMCLEDGRLRRLSLSASLEGTSNQNVLLRSASHGRLGFNITPTVWRVDAEGHLSVATLAQGAVGINGNAHFLVNRDVLAVEGRVDGQITTENLLSSVSGEGQLDWHISSGVTVGSYHSLQGRLNLKVLGTAPGAGILPAGAAANAEGGFYMGINAPKSEAYILQGADPRYALNMAALPDRLTGAYGYVKGGGALSLILVSGGFDVYSGLGVFKLTPQEASALGAMATPGSPYGIGNVGMDVWGKILAGLVSAQGGTNMQVMLPYPFHFQGTLRLGGCVAWVACGDVDLTVGLNSAQGYYLH